MNIQKLFLLFIIYSILGWAIEVINSLIVAKKWVNRGFLIGPYCPIYGVGSILITLLISSKNDVIGVFLKSMAICSILEYSTSYIMEKLFKTRWWDYSKNKYNINGRICLETMSLFGIGGVLIVKFLSPTFLYDINLLSPIFINILAIVIAILFISDIIVSYKIINSFKKISFNVKKDSTEDITTMVKDVISEKSYLYKRLASSFPRFQSVIQKKKV